jgi:hypothetical protein
MFNCRIELASLFAIKELQYRGGCYQDEKVYAALKSVMIHLHQNILTFLHLLFDKQKQTQDQFLSQMSTLKINSQTCQISLKQLCKAVGNPQFKELEMLVSKIDLSNNTKSSALSQFEQDLRQIGLNNVVSTPPQVGNKRQSVSNAQPRHKEASPIRDCEVELSLPSKKCDRLYTLVLDLDETLIHFDPQTKQFRSRPYCLSFLRTLCNYFEIVIFTAATQNYAD